MSIVFLVQPADQPVKQVATHKMRPAAPTRTQVRQNLVLCCHFRTRVEFCQCQHLNLVHKMLHFGANPGLGAMIVRVLSIDDR